MHALSFKNSESPFENLEFYLKCGVLASLEKQDILQALGQQISMETTAGAGQWLLLNWAAHRQGPGAGGDGVGPGVSEPPALAITPAPPCRFKIPGAMAMGRGCSLRMDTYSQLGRGPGSPCGGGSCPQRRYGHRRSAANCSLRTQIPSDLGSCPVGSPAGHRTGLNPSHWL